MLLKKIFSPFRTRFERLLTTQFSVKRDILTKEVNKNGLIIINRPEKLNVVDLAMIENLGIVLNEWKNTKSLIIIRGNGNKAFCAGGDVKDIAELGAAHGMRIAKANLLNKHLIRNLNVPYVALMDGITMGTGLGLSIHGKYRIATENTVSAMPETIIGFLPDVGASYFLPRLRGKLGYYLGLTGSSLKGQDVVHAGIATHYCDSAKIQELEYSLLHLNDPKHVGSVINDFCPKVQSEFSLAKNLDQIDECFDATSVEEILHKLECDGSQWAQKTKKTLRALSPTSLKVTLRQLNLGAHLSLGECLQMEYRLIFHFFQDSDFYEGVRALLIAKDKHPKWNPPSIEDVPIEQVLSFFEPLPDNDGLPIKEKFQAQI